MFNYSEVKIKLLFIRFRETLFFLRRYIHTCLTLKLSHLHSERRHAFNFPGC